MGSPRVPPCGGESPDGPGAELARTMKVHHGSEPAADAFTAVKYKDHWFWISDNDFRSKRTFTFLMILFSLTETGGDRSLPLVTIPAG